METTLNKVIIVSAPSGAGKSTIVKHLLSTFPVLGFSISATTRAIRNGEQAGREYYFLKKEDFEKMIAENKLLEWEEVYAGSYYGTPKSEVNRLHSTGKIPIFDVDVKGGVNIKRMYGKNALSVFIKPPSIAVLEQRLRNRQTDTEESLQKRLAKAQTELAYEPEFDCVVINDTLDIALKEAENIVKTFLES